ncbi:MarR family winged helix-turn-helix transcriptional regulator [Frateuria aurantia]|uniref:Transcriptional regulator n=1 Tax=Frateuria aurantia (strain ATCC 33424 / DSM 6220 / KCTC 2777 / LMG 1558 / NBRC 3245 / NCIMB 13370) TaxID=767434 RepID=H8L186_FRAAD|nr:MarR family transcriptional regulator [Frateuria aurantia]AFC87494.1 transcriptional regulator [Frateuria aurantia DSM 6220]
MKSSPSLPRPAIPRLENQLCFSLYAAGLAMNKVYRRLLKPMGVTYLQYLVLMVLWERDGLTVSAIGDRLSLDSATLTPLLKRMEAAGLLRRQRSQADERQVEIWLTAAGQHLQDSARAVQPAIAQACGCPVEELIGIKRSLDDLRGRLVAVEASLE